MKISILIPSRNGQEFLEWAYKSIRKNEGDHYVKILVLDDISDKDDTWEWCESTMKTDPMFKAFQNETGTRFGISSGYKYLSKFATEDVICHWHNDMFMTEGTLDAIEDVLFERERVDIGYGDYWTNFKPLVKNVVCLTRIEPTIYCEAGLYPEKIVWDDAPIELVDWNEQKFIDYLPTAQRLWNNKTTEGHFAPFFMFRKEYLELGSNDTINFPFQAREDSDWAFRLALAEFNTVQIPHFVYHFASRGNRRSKHESGNFVDNPEWQQIEYRSVRNFIRKWQTLNLHDDFLKPAKPVRFKTIFKVKRCTPYLLNTLEPWCDYFDCDLPVQLIEEYVEKEQPNTAFDLSLKLFGLPDIQNIVIEINGMNFSNDDFKYIQNLSEIITDSGEIGEFSLGNLDITINDLTHYEKDLIVCKS